MMIRIVVEMQGGLAKNVFSPDWPEAQVVLIDWDALDTMAGESSDVLAIQGPVDDYANIHPVTKQVVEALQTDAPLTIAQAQAAFDALDQKP